ncbi:tetratricopeptide repeat protein [Chitinophaga horti]|uniref:Tetratricopeptide repeat protein n=1 Tax=Chitinophaga horti TaxID=2920382 RepID=A0ABY6IWC9_9BACT|nr:tetratricopeptide repeat protein [Chitinophaga horti]UYQ91671.1 tetratricopeptide repeat protein [Chitinophaga horti]
MRDNIYPYSMLLKSLPFIVILYLALVGGVTAQDSVLVYKTLDSLRAMKDDTSKVDLLAKRGRTFNRYFDGRNAENVFYKDAINLGENIRDYRHLAEIYNEIGTSKRNRSLYILAADYHEKALANAKLAKNDRLISFSYNNLGVDYRRLDKLDKAFDAHFSALRIAEKINDVRNICVATNSIGNIHLSNKKYEEAIRDFAKALQLEQDAGNELGVAINLGNIGYAYQGLGKLDLSIEFFKRSLEANQKINSTTGISICYTCLGAVYQDKKDYNTAKSYMLKALAVNGEVDDQIHVADNYLSIGKLFDEQGVQDSARLYYQQAIDLGRRWGFKSTLLDAYKGMAHSLRESKQYERSLAYMDSLIVYNDSIQTEKNELVASQSETRYNVSRKDAEIKTLHQAQDNEKLRVKRNLAVAISLGVILLMLIVGGFFYIRHRNLEANRQALQLELRSLRAQMNPHFIFNSLSSIHRYIWSNNQEEASEYLTKFSKLMRMILDNSQHTFIPLNKELESLKLYLDLEVLRCNNMFEYHILLGDNINDEEVMIPPMIIQPYVENAIWHGLVHRKLKGLLEISIRLKGRVLECIVTDNGIGRKMAMEIKEKKNKTHNSMGMKVTEGRIALIRKINNTKDANVEITDLEDAKGQPEGTKVTIVLPAEFLF